MEYRNNTSGAVETRSAILAKYPNTSFPKPLTNTVIESLGYKTIKEGAQPSLTPPYESAVRDGIEEISDRGWFTKYKKVTATGDAKTKIDTDRALAVRTERDKKLHDCDWTQAADTALASDKKADWATYRTSLRNLPAASGFPHTHTWPTAPS